MSARAPSALEPPAFASIAHELRDEIIEHCERRGARLDTAAGLVTLDTNSLLAPRRGRLLLRLLAEEGAGAIEGLRVLDLGAGYGALALYWAHLGADVVAVDPNEERMKVAIAIAARRGLPLTAVCADAQSLPVPDASIDLIVANNSLCYIAERRGQERALREAHRVLRPGGWLITRNPNRLHPRDQFTGVPLLGVLAPPLARRAAQASGRHRSDVRLLSPGAAARALRRAGFSEARWRAAPGRRHLARFAGYHHVLARRTASASSPPAGPRLQARAHHQT